ncbi:hypothetical protein K2173_022513 [Erythroxylum novogranatense]|uniref:RING-type E3 ubiquitin transferase n=1 Tax=Erythroxylum novogranatense TaxID=1862640 RepID=A0AAV8TKH3_9ROSI|nr:hypothetical protein K2173_022513 [Erythroxylum novogranatense]
MEGFDSFPSSSSSSSVTEKRMLSFVVSPAGGVVDEDLEDACSICLEPFTSEDPATITNCKHEYHLQCILEWCQRSKECPICWQLISLKVPASQELLDAIENERHLRTKNTIRAAVATNVSHFHEDHDEEQDSYSDDSDVDERFAWLQAAAASRASFKRERQRSFVLSPPEYYVFTSGDGLSLSSGSSGGNSPAPNKASAPSLPFSYGETISAHFMDRDIPITPSAPFTQSSNHSPPVSDCPSLSESLKSRWSVASARYKETISKSTRDIKEKLLAHNNSVKELSRGVQKEMSAGVARMIDRLDLSSKRNGSSSPVSNATAGISNFFQKGKAVQENVLVQAHDVTSSGASPHV